MTKDSLLLKDKVLPRVNNLLKKCAKNANVELTSIVLFGSKATGNKNSQNEYEVLVLLKNDTTLEDYVKYTNIIRLELLKEKLSRVKTLVFTPQTFQNLLFKEEMIGTYLYIICKNNIIMYDKDNAFVSILRRILNSSLKQEEKFIKQCIKFAKDLGSEKWGQKWEKALMNLKYEKNRG